MKFYKIMFLVIGSLLFILHIHIIAGVSDNLLFTDDTN